MDSGFWIFLFVIAIVGWAAYKAGEDRGRSAERPPSLSRARTQQDAEMIWKEAKAMADCLIRDHDASMHLARLIDLSGRTQPFGEYARELAKDIIMSNPETYMHPDHMDGHMFAAAQLTLISKR